MPNSSALEAAEELFASYRGPGSEATRIGELVLPVLLQGREPEALSATETHCLLKAYNWTFRHEDGYKLAKHAIVRWGDEFMPDLSLALRNAYYWPREAYFSAIDDLIREGIGAAADWHLRKADWWLMEATGEHCSEREWYPGDEITDPAALEEVAVELDRAIQTASPDLPLPDSTWTERYGPVMELPRFSRFFSGPGDT